MSRLAGPVEEWVHELRALNRSPQTVRAYLSDVAQLARWLGRPLEEATADDLRRFVRALHEAGLSARSRARKVVAIRRFYEYLMDSRGLPNPAERLEVPRVPRERVPRFMREEEVSRLLAAIPRTVRGRRDRAIVELGLSGLRVGEIAGLRVHDLFLEEGQVRITGKGGGEFLAFVTPAAVRALREWLDVRPLLSGSEYVFCAVPPRGRGGLRPESMERILRGYLKAAGIGTAYTMHSLRHTAGYVLANRDVPLHVIQEILRHRDPRTTRIYTALSPAHVREVMAAYLRFNH